MLNPYLAALQYQAAMFDGWIRVATCAWAHYGRLVMLPQHLLEHQEHVRAKDVPHRGPDLNDHYGRRARDVDVERV